MPNMELFKTLKLNMIVSMSIGTISVGVELDFCATSIAD